MHDHGVICAYGGGLCVGCGVRDYQFVALRILHIDRYRTVVLTWKCREMQGQTGHSPYPVSLCNWHSRPTRASRLRESPHSLSAAPNPRNPFHLTQFVHILGYAHSCMDKCSSWNITPVCSGWNILYIQPQIASMFQLEHTTNMFPPEHFAAKAGAATRAAPTTPCARR